MSAPILSIVIPVLDEAQTIAPCLQALQPLRDEGCEIIVCDGGSRDGTMALARPLADCVLPAPRGRARQMNAGAAVAEAEVLLFLHADTRLPQDVPRLILNGLNRRGAVWGRFDVRLSGDHPLLRLVEVLMNLRSRLTGIATGDQCLFVTRRAFDAAGGFPHIDLMEDIALSKHLKRAGRPLCLPDRVVTSSRRWENQGIAKTILIMWWLRLRFHFGADPGELAELYCKGVLWKRLSD